MKIIGINQNNSHQQNKPSFGRYFGRLNLNVLKELPEGNKTALATLLQEGCDKYESKINNMVTFSALNGKKAYTTVINPMTRIMRGIIDLTGKTIEEEKIFNSKLINILGEHANNKAFFDSVTVDTNNVKLTEKIIKEQESWVKNYTVSKHDLKTIATEHLNS